MSSKSIATNEELARAIPELVATDRELDRLDDVLAGDVIEHGPMGELRGPDAVKESMRRILAAFSDLTATVEDVVSEGDMVALRVTLRGTQDGPFMGLEPTGNSFEVGNLVLTRIEDGRIAERWVIPDMLGMMRQLGVSELPTP